jgi:hypothetical protein
MSICIRGSSVSSTATLQENIPQGRALSEVSAQILWSLYRAQACGTSCLSVIFAQPIFHVSCLKRVIGAKCQIQTNLPELDEEGSIWLQPEEVLDQRERRLH